MANDLITTSEMALWTQSDLSSVASDPFATDVRTKISDYIKHAAGHPEWTASTVPINVKMLAIRVIRRTYVNPDSEVSSNVGPIGSRILDDAALAGAFTEAEEALLAGLRPDGSGSPGLWVQDIGGSTTDQLPPTIYVDDNLQINLGGMPPWSIPYLDINDVGVQDEDFE